MLPDDLAKVLDIERHRLGISSAELVRQALEAYLKPRSEGRRYSFIGMVSSDNWIPAEEIDAYLDKQADEIYADSFSQPVATGDPR
jgi:hypothetical protein